MIAFSFNQLLEVFENHLALNGQHAGEAMLFFNDSNLTIGYHQTDASFRNLDLPSRFSKPLNALEERRLQSLDRKAKGGLLSEQEDREFEALLEIRRYFEKKAAHPHYTHHQVLVAIRA